LKKAKKFPWHAKTEMQRQRKFHSRLIHPYEPEAIATEEKDN